MYIVMSFILLQCILCSLTVVVLIKCCYCMTEFKTDLFRLQLARLLVMVSSHTVNSKIMASALCISFNETAYFVDLFEG